MGRRNCHDKALLADQQNWMGLNGYVDAILQLLMFFIISMCSLEYQMPDCQMQPNCQCWQWWHLPTACQHVPYPALFLYNWIFVCEPCNGYNFKY